ncbi:TPA: hypothetical protein MI627_26435 [Klebsiella pneumoniae]|uniref:hypothetical protein n=1 Tax=Klebsiella pneumoniae TaxID=573 RepID=UPI0007423E1A|nr:hypothetical protein [Klebsiella pneumoniae]SLY50880.1 Uncharacterised protein [Klebsiella quasivariicola]KSY35442.1 hypothetical protein APU04_23575 [Klebsiella pneumoniae]MBA7838313.1 hypothetical protein [Klebsiella pneumoniae]MDE4761029.1 hypothetical protein [Klebsiella pneumoniae]VGE74865.1 Uncharacterised protein [Klebsiella pneumoniae]
MTWEFRKRSDIERNVSTGETVAELPRHAIKETNTDHLLSNQPMPERLPTCYSLFIMIFLRISGRDSA